jgi:hypothetical protein
MPTTRYYISGCPFDGECGAKKTTNGKKHVLIFYGSTAVEAQGKCANHLLRCSLHNKSRFVAWAAAIDQDIHTIKHCAELVAWDSIDRLLHTFDDSNSGEENETHEVGMMKPSKCPRLEYGCGDEAEAGHSIAKLSSNVSMSIEAASSSGSLRATKGYIADAEQAARKAQNIAINAALAFGDVAEKLNRVIKSLPTP